MSREIGYQIRENKAGTQKMIYHYKRGQSERTAGLTNWIARGDRKN